MKTENNHKKNYRKKIEAQLHNLVNAHLSNINKDAASKISKTIQEAVKQIAKKFYKTQFLIETDKNEKVISEIVKAKSIKKLPSKSLPAKASSIKFDKIIEKKESKPLSKAKTKKTVAVKKIVAKKVTPIKKATVKKSTTKKLPTAIAAKKEKLSATKSNSLLNSIPKEFKMTISKKTSKK